MEDYLSMEDMMERQGMVTYINAALKIESINGKKFKVKVFNR
jgi:hypothetical protein